RVTATGQKSTSLGGETVYSLNLKEMEQQINALDNSRTDLLTHIPRVLEKAGQLSGYLAPVEAVAPVFTGRIQKEGYAVEKYFINGEGDYVVPYLLMIPDKPNGKALLYLEPSGKAKASYGEEAVWFVENGTTVLAPDMLGVGATGSPAVNYNHAYVQRWIASLLIGRSIVGVQAAEVVRLSRLLEDKPGISEVYGYARGEMAPVLLHAAAFHPGIKRIALIEPYSSYRSIVANRFYDVGLLYSVVPGALTAYDLSDLAASLAPRKLLIAGIKDGYGRHNKIAEISKDIDVVNKAYNQSKASAQLEIKPFNTAGKYNPYLMDWIE